MNEISETENEILRTILSAFGMDGGVTVQRIDSGLMHATYEVGTPHGHYALQRLHPKLSTPEIMGDYVAVTDHLASRGIESPRLVRTRQGEPMHLDNHHRWWRLSSWIDGETFSKVSGPVQAEQGARILARFHLIMEDINHDFASQHPLHDTAAHLAMLERAVAVHSGTHALDAIEASVEFIFERLPELVLSSSLPRRVVHGDPKISNVRFRNGQAVALIDLDTCNAHSLLVDLGDATRSWCRDGYEDEEQRFHLDRFEAIVRGYASEGPALCAEERESLADAGPLITLELASRFARDALEDEYFAFDAQRYPSRVAHNRTRMKSMLFLEADMRAKKQQIESIINRYFR